MFQETDNVVILYINGQLITLGELFWREVIWREFNLAVGIKKINIAGIKFGGWRKKLNLAGI